MISGIIKREKFPKRIKTRKLMRIEARVISFDFIP